MPFAQRLKSLFRIIAGNRFAREKTMEGSKKGALTSMLQKRDFLQIFFDELARDACQHVQQLLQSEARAFEVASFKMISDDCLSVDVPQT